MLLLIAGVMAACKLAEHMLSPSQHPQTYLKTCCHHLSTHKHPLRHAVALQARCHGSDVLNVTSLLNGVHA